MVAAWILRLDGRQLPSREVIGGKAYSIAQMTALNLSVPPAFVVTTEACRAYLKSGTFPEGLSAELDAGVAWLEEQTGRTFDRGPKPLLLSVRSGAPISMPGMMDTVLNLGINDDTERALATLTGDAAFARDTHRRFLELYARLVLKTTGVDIPPSASPQECRSVVEHASGHRLPDTAREQLHAAVRVVFDSWNTRRAKRYRKHQNIPDDLGTAVTIQAMVFGNQGERSGTGVLFSRNPLSGDPSPYGEYLPCAQGEDVVSGSVTPAPLSALAVRAPLIHEKLLDAAEQLEKHARDVQDIEFTVENDQLFLLQTRAAKRAARAAVRFAVDFVDEGLIDEQTALRRVTADQIRSLLRPVLAASASHSPIAQGDSACPGVACGIAVQDSDEAEQRAGDGEDIVLVREKTSPDDVHAMIAARAIVTETGGTTSHAAVVSRQLNLPCVVGCGVGVVASLTGKTITVDGNNGKVYVDRLPVSVTQVEDDIYLSRLSAWAQQASTLEARAPAPGGESDGFNLDQLVAADEVATFARLIGNHKTVSGAVLNHDNGIAAAVEAGVKTVIVEHPLPALIAAIHYRDKIST